MYVSYNLKYCYIQRRGGERRRLEITARRREARIFKQASNDFVMALQTGLMLPSFFIYLQHVVRSGEFGTPGVISALSRKETRATCVRATLTGRRVPRSSPRDFNASRTHTTHSRARSTSCTARIVTGSTVSTERPKTRISYSAKRRGARMQIRICNENKKRGRIHNSRCKLEIN